MDKNNFIISENDTPQSRSHKLKLYYYVILAFSLITNMWPIFVILIFMQNRIIQWMGQAVDKNYIKQGKYTEPKTPKQVNNAKQSGRNVVKVDYGRSILAIVGAVVIIIATLGFHYIPKFYNHPDSEEFRETVENTRAVVFLDYENIKEHNMEDASLNSFPERVLKASNLEILNISHNNISDTLPAEIRNLTKLRILDISNNKMTNLPAEIGQLTNLEELDLSNNLFTGLPHELANLKTLKTLNISGNNYSVYDLDIIAAGLSNTDIIKK